MALSTRSPSQPALDAARARQGALGRNMLWVLLIALALVVLGFLATYVAHAPKFARATNPRATVNAAGSFNAPQPAAANRQNYQSGGPLAPNNHGNPGQPNRSNTGEP